MDWNQWLADSQITTPFEAGWPRCCLTPISLTPKVTVWFSFRSDIQVYTTSRNVNFFMNETRILDLLDDKIDNSKINFTAMNFEPYI